MREEIFRMERVTYIEKGIIQLKDFNLQIFQGEIMGFLPVNAHGLPAFLKLLQSNLPLHDGFVYYGETLINSWKASRKGYNRISIIQNQSCLVEGMRVSDTIFVLRQGFRQRIIRSGLLRRQLEPFLRDIGMDISADTYVEKLSYFERIVVEMLRAVIMGHRLIVLNEVSTLISEVELKKLYRIMRKYASQGISFLYISLHFEDILQICDRAALLSYGRVQKVIGETQMSLDTMLEYPEEFNRMVRVHMQSEKGLGMSPDVVLELHDITYGALERLHVKIHAGECVVIQSLDYSIYKSLIGLLIGERRLEGGEILLEGEPVAIRESKSVAVIRELPTRSMIFPGMSYMDNLCFGLLRRVEGIWHDRAIKESVRMEYGSFLGEDVFYMQMEELTEMQKYQLVYTRILLQRPKVVFCIQPFKGADMPHRLLIWKMMETLLQKGIAVVIIAINLADSMSFAERLLRIDGNGMVVEVSREEFSHLSASTPWAHLYRKEEEI